jgi:hypothetical protein
VGPVDEECNCRGCQRTVDSLTSWCGGQRSNASHRFSVDTQWLARRGQHTDRRRCRQQRIRERCGVVDDVFTVVENDQQPSPTNEVAQEVEGLVALPLDQSENTRGSTRDELP